MSLEDKAEAQKVQSHKVTTVKPDPKKVNPEHKKLVAKILQEDKELLERLANA